MTAVPASDSPPIPHTASASQREAIEAEPGPLLVLAGPGAGKTYCLIERIRFLVEKKGIDPSRICAFTFTNKAAGEISHRLEKFLGPSAELIRRGTIHSFCVELLRKYGQENGLEAGFGIVDEDYQRTLLRRIGVQGQFHNYLLKEFTAYRFIGGHVLSERDQPRYADYMQFLEKRNLVDFDMLVLKTAELLRSQSVLAQVQDRWDCILVDEFQDLNRVQYSIIRSIGMTHRNVFAVGDDEQSIYSWAGADPTVFTDFLNDFNAKRIQIRENRRCPKGIVAIARKLINVNTPIFTDERFSETTRESPFETKAIEFEHESDELTWIIDDLRHDRELNHLEWGDFALLYRKHEIGYGAETAFLTAGVPCRMAQGRALSEDPVVSYLIAALKVISDPTDPIHHEGFLKVVLPRPLFDSIRARAEEKRRSFISLLEKIARSLPKKHGDRGKIWRGLYALRNLTALGTRHSSVSDLVDELLSQRVGEYKTMLETNHDDLSDPIDNDEVQVLAARLTEAVDFGKPVWIPRLGGLEIALKGMLKGENINRIELGGLPSEDAIRIGHSDCGSLGLALGLFKALQIIRSKSFTNHFRDFTAIDIETTDKDIAKAELVEIAAVKVRDGVIVDSYSSYVKPRVPITAGARGAHGIADSEVEGAPYFEDIWPIVREFCGRDVVVAHNGYQFDFPIIRRMAKPIGGMDFVTYDTLLLARELHSSSRKLEDLARVYSIEKGQSHRALDDTTTLAHLFLHLGEAKVARARKTSLDNLLDFLGMALVLSNEESLCQEAATLRNLTKVYPLFRYSDSLEFYRNEYDAGHDATTVDPDQIIELLGGADLMLRLRTEKTADQRYPAAMLRLRPLLDLFDGQPLKEQIGGFLERVALSKMDGAEPETARVNLLTLHSTKGLEFSRVYVVGCEDAQLPGGKDPSKKEVEEARRLLYVGMTRTKDRLVLTKAKERGGKPTGGSQFLDEVGLVLTEL